MHALQHMHARHARTPLSLSVTHAHHTPLSLTHSLTSRTALSHSLTHITRRSLSLTHSHHAPLSLTHSHHTPLSLTHSLTHTPLSQTHSLTQHAALSHSLTHITRVASSCWKIWEKETKYFFRPFWNKNRRVHERANNMRRFLSIYLSLSLTHTQITRVASSCRTRRCITRSIQQKLRKTREKKKGGKEQKVGERPWQVAPEHGGALPARIGARSTAWHQEDR